MKKHRHDDPLVMPGSALLPEVIFANAGPLSGTPGEVYALRRGVSVEVANAFGVRYHHDFGGRPAVVVALRDEAGRLTSVHGRYLSTVGAQEKMLTVGKGGGAISSPWAWKTDPLILVEGLFDALSLAVSGWQSVATIGRPVPWLPSVCSERVVWAAFDAGRSGEANVESFREQLNAAVVRRLPPPPRCKDWSTALVKRGRHVVARWVRDAVMAAEAM